MSNFYHSFFYNLIIKNFFAQHLIKKSNKGVFSPYTNVVKMGTFTVGVGKFDIDCR